ncbi:MAG: flagellar hook-associated protein FlgL [Desulfosarcinaceae bacterium]|nr:flagellar hook-associated protein FlgL [Desulfosarcinaceae bacterium]
MRVSNKMLADNITANLFRQTEQIVRKQREVYTGKRINSASDDPIGIGQALRHRKTIAAIEQYQTNIKEARMRIEHDETIFDTVEKLLQQAVDMSLDTNVDNRLLYAEQVSDIREEILQLANSKMGDDYIFGGYQTGTEPFLSDGTYVGDGGEKAYSIANNIQIDLKTDGSDIFQGAHDVFAVLDQLSTDLTSGTAADIASHAAPLNEVIDHLETVRAQASAAYQRLELTDAHWGTYKVNVENMLSSIEDVDPAEVIVELQALQTAYETSLATSAKIIQPNLMQFLS